MKMRYEFVEFIPEDIEDGVLYVSTTYGTVVHNCCCGCGTEVVTPLSPTDWKITFDGETVSLHPSIGNWEFPCQSHYWIRRNSVEWAGQWSKEEIEEGRRQDHEIKKEHYDDVDKTAVLVVDEPETIKKPKRWWILRFLFGD